MINFDYVTKEKIREHNPNQPQIPDHPCRVLITHEKVDYLFTQNLKNKQTPGTDKNKEINFSVICSLLCYFQLLPLSLDSYWIHFQKLPTWLLGFYSLL